MGVPQKPTPQRKAETKDPFPGTVINGKYRVLSVLAHGGMGKIYNAEQVPLRRPVALKILRTRYADEVEDDPQFQKRFFQEASILSRLQHNHIVTLYDYGRIEAGTGDQYFMAMELLRGETLSRRIRARGALPVLDVLRIVRQMAKGLYAAHKLEIVHRDLKPSNIMLVPEEDGGEVVKILDFGISKIVTSDAAEDLTAEGAFLGSPRYMAPEQVGDGKVDARTDIYALGVILYECLCGKLPFDGETNIGIMMAHCNTPVPPMRDRNPTALVPEPLEALARHCLQKEAAMRPRNMDEFLRELGACEAAISGGQVPISLGSLPNPSSGRLPMPSGPNDPTVSGTFDSAASASSPPPRPSGAPTGTHRSLTKSQRPSAEGQAQPASRTSSRAMIFGALATVAVLGVAATFALTRASNAPAPAATSRTSFVLIVESTPSNAEVREGDHLLGTTPLRVPIDHASVRGEPRTFIVSRSGYAPYTVVQGDSTDDLRVLATLAELVSATASANAALSASTASSTTTRGGRPAPSTTAAPTRVTPNPDLDIKLKR